MKITRLIFTLALLIVALIPSSIVQAASGQNRLITSVPTLKIETETKIEINRPVTITVFDKQRSDVIAGASVYALPSHHAIINVNKSDNYTSLIDKYEEMATRKGMKIGITDENGKTTGTFDQTGHYLLVALKDGYKPGFSHIKVSPVARDELIIESPEKAKTDEPVSISVKEKQSGLPVVDAGVYALRDKIHIDRFIKQQPIDNGTATQIIIETVPSELLIKEESDNFSSKWLTGIIFLGKTGGDGTLKYTFNRTGAYMLIAVKESYKVGRCHIKILPQTTIKQPVIQNHSSRIAK